MASNFLTQPHNIFMGVYGFAWIQAITYKVVCTRGQILGPGALCQVLAFWYMSGLLQFSAPDKIKHIIYFFLIKNWENRGW